MGRRIVLAAALAAVFAATPAVVQARKTAPRLTRIKCVPAHSPPCRHGVRAGIGKQLQLSGRRLYKGMRVSFRWSLGALATKLQRSRVGWVVRVPAGTRAGRVKVRVRGRHKRFSNYVRIRVTAPKRVITPATSGLPAAFTGNGMWIWQLPRAEGGDPAAIAARASASGISTVFVKSSDGPINRWSQFNPTLVQTLHASGLHVCAWQYVYGSDPVGEAQLGASAVADGADCLVIDAEKEYEGRYAAAQTYLQALRAAIGPDYPLGLTSFPFVDYHPGLPYSVFLGPGGAQTNVPQVYWKTIGGTVDAVSGHTLAHNRLYGRPIAPLGQAYDGPPPADMQRFRQIWTAYGSGGMSWWDWQHATPETWAAIAAPAPGATSLPDPGWPALEKGSKGDEVVWLQEHLASTDPTLAVDGRFGAATDQAVRSLQAARGIAVTGVTDAATWQAALALPSHSVDWTARATGPRARAARAGEGRAPRSAHLPAHRDEIPPAGRRG